MWYAQVSVPPKVNPFMCDEDSDVESVSDDSDDSDDLFDEDSGSSSDTSYVDAEPSSSDSSNLSTDSGEGSSMDVDPPLQPDEDDLSILTARNARKWCQKWLSGANKQTLIMTKWRDSLRDYLLCTETSEVSYILDTILVYSDYKFKTSKASLGERQQAAVTSLREMRAVRKKYYDNNSWRRRVKV